MQRSPGVRHKRERAPRSLGVLVRPTFQPVAYLFPDRREPLRAFRTVSVTVVAGERLASDAGTNRPLLADLVTFLIPFPIDLTSLAWWDRASVTPS
jgi:hypothetical protein